MNKIFSKQNVIDLYHTLQEADIPIWLDGGWGVDALLEEQTRVHDDLDIVIEKKKFRAFFKYYSIHGIY